jgi:methylthioribose-1-phosphate isomerase
MRPVEWVGNSLRIIDQTKLPGALVYIDLQSYPEVIGAIKELKVRGAPAIGVAAAYGIALAAQQIDADNKEQFLINFNQALQDFAESRPTAVNLFRTIDRMRKRVTLPENISDIKQAVIDEAMLIHAEEKSATERLSRLGADLIENGFTIMTHCNAGPLATAAYGTALGVIIAAKEQGKQVSVIANETRPLLQGARLTTWELIQEHIPVTLITDSMAGHFLSRGGVDCVIVGADRIAINGDTANKIGTYTLAVVAAENDVPFYVAAPVSTIDFSLNSGTEIPIEERNPEEITSIRELQVATEGVKAANPAFDVTPHRYITALITEKGLIKHPFEAGLRELAKEAT